MKQKQIGEVAVDSGQIVIADPCHIGNPDMLVAFDTQMGDGIYPVWEVVDENGAVLEWVIGNPNAKLWVKEVACIEQK